ncbi:MAG: DUF2500 family protein [Clostridia bacterium]|nr:DUF2500 family protein [Clostridia bacterium]
MNLDNLTPEVLRAGVTMLVFGLCAVAATFLVGVFTKYAGPLLRERKALDITMLAIVGGKRTRMLAEDEDQADSPRSVHYFVTFEPDVKRPMELEVTPEQYERLKEGVRGYLTVQDRSFVSFTSEDEVAKA